MTINVVDRLLWFALLLPLYLEISARSLKYYAVKYQVSTEALGIFLNRVPPGLKWFYRSALKDFRGANNDRTPERIQNSMTFLRILSSFFPALGILAILGGFFRFLNEDGIINYGY